MKPIASLPEELDDVVSLWSERLESSHPGSVADLGSAPDCEAGITKLVAVSEFAANLIIREWPWNLSIRDSGAFQRPPDIRELQAFTAEVSASADEVGGMKRRLRRFRNRWLLQVLWTDVSGTASLAETLKALTDLADEMIPAAASYASMQLQRRFGIPRNDNGAEIPLVVMAMGKLGGGELNFSSDVDLIFLYPEDGETDGSCALSAHE